jgi:hypothetical protein
MSAFQVLAEPHRRHILDLLREGERSVNELVAGLGLGQPGVSKRHLDQSAKEPHDRRAPHGRAPNSRRDRREGA